MNLTSSVVLSLAVAGLVRRTWPHASIPAGVLVAVVLLTPPLAVPCIGLVALFLAWRRLRLRTSTLPDAGQVTLLAELTSLGLSAGLSFSQALREAGRYVADPLAAEVGDVLRMSRTQGLATVLERVDGHGKGLYRIAGRAIRTGAPVRPAVAGLVDELRAEERATELERARKLPVKMLFPLALLILPGFLVLTVGPTLLGALDRLRL